MILLEVVADGRLGGGTTHVLQLIEALREALPVEVHLASQAGSPALVEGARLGAAAHGLDFFASRLDPRLWHGLRCLVRRLRPALIHAHGARATLPITWAAQGAPLLHTVHGYHFVGKPFALRRLAVLAERRCSARAEVTIFVSRHDRDLAARTGILARCRRHQVIPNGIETAGLPEAIGSPDRRQLAFLGRLSPEKNPLLVLEVLDLLRTDGYRLNLIGDGPLMDPLRRRAVALGLADRVELHGALARPRALETLAASDALLVTSLWEGMPLAPLEAMAIGVPVVASATGGLSELIEPARTGFLIADHDPSQYAKAVRELDAPDLRARMVAAARRVVAERYAWNVIKPAYLQLYCQLLRLG